MHRGLCFVGSVLLTGSAVRQKVIEEDDFCSTLFNEGSFCTVDVEVGTPPQKMRIVADTGSDLFLVESCACEDSGSCKNDGKCFRGGNGKSSSFMLGDKPLRETITYGSGPIDAVVATDEVKVGGVRADMQDSLLLIARNRLRGHLQLNGILGLGMPHGTKSLSRQKGFLDQAHVHRFSMCFNSEGKDGVLRMGSDLGMDKALQAAGSKHWGVDFRGVTVGNHAEMGETSLLEDQSTFCNEAEGEQETPCAAIVDSGTTLILAPKEHLTKLFAQICDAWPKCRANSVLLSFQGQEAEGMLHMMKSKSFLEEAAACDFESMPSLYFHVRGKDGVKDTLKMTPDDYMMVTKHKLSIGEFFGVRHTHKVCKPAFEAKHLPTSRNGPVWILGTPFFYKFNVAYDRSTTPPALSFNRAECGSCAGGPASSLMRTRMHLVTPPRASFFNATLGL